MGHIRSTAAPPERLERVEFRFWTRHCVQNRFCGIMFPGARFPPRLQRSLSVISMSTCDHQHRQLSAPLFPGCAGSRGEGACGGRALAPPGRTIHPPLPSEKGTTCCFKKPGLESGPDCRIRSELAGQRYAELLTRNATCQILLAKPFTHSTRQTLYTQDPTRSTPNPERKTTGGGSLIDNANVEKGLIWTRLGTKLKLGRFTTHCKQ